MILFYFCQTNKQQIYQIYFFFRSHHQVLKSSTGQLKRKEKFQNQIQINQIGPRFMKTSSVPLITNNHNSKSHDISLKLDPFKSNLRHENITTIETRQRSSSGNKFSRKMASNAKLQSPVVKRLRNFVKNEKVSETYANEFVNLQKNSFLLNNRLTKSLFDISDATLMGKPQSLNLFRPSRSHGSQSVISSLKNAVNKITKPKKSLIPKLYQKSLSLGDFTFVKNKNSTSILQKDQQFFPITGLEETKKIIKQSLDKLSPDNLKDRSSSSKLKLQFLYKQKKFENSKLSKPLSERKIVKIDQKINELKLHNNSMQKLIPKPIIKPEKISIKGRGQIVSQDKIIRVIDKLLSVLQLYFQMHGENGIRVMDFIKNIDGFENAKLKEILCQKNYIKHIKSAEQIKRYFWIFKYQKVDSDQNEKTNSNEKEKTNSNEKEKTNSNEKEKTNSNEKEKSIQSQKEKFKLPEFFGEEDSALYKIINNFALKLESKYENDHKQKYKRVRQLAAEKQSQQFNRLYTGANKSIQLSSYEEMSPKKNFNFLTPERSEKNKSILMMSGDEHISRKSLMQKIKFNAINNDKKMSSQIEQLEDLGVKFDFKQKGRSIILSQRSKIAYSKR